jgi:eukaryotic-like serine/threonine-protein kinase
MRSDTHRWAVRLLASDLEADALEGERMRNVLKARLLDQTAPETKIDRFVVLRQIGVGGMGVVYAAYDPELDRKVAIKLVRTWGLPKRAVDQARLIREARALARLSHPNVVAVFEVGLHREDVFLAMEFVHGRTLRDHAASGATWRDKLRAYLQAGEGLAAAHVASLVHRDFKPDNAIVGEDGRVRVVDFGIALAEGSDSPSVDTVEQREAETPLTATGAVLGTLAYMAPEQRQGFAVVPRSDQYSFCAALHEALVGVPPGHEGAVAAMRTRGRELPPRLRAAIARGLAHEVDERFPDMPTLLLELRASLEGGRRLVAAALFTAIASLGAGALWFGGFQRNEPCSDPTMELDGVWSDSTRSDLRAAAHELGGPAPTSAAIVERELDRYARDWVAARRDACEAHWVRRTDADTVFDRRMRCLDRGWHALDELVQLVRERDPAIWQRAVEAVTALPSVAACADVEALAAESAWPEDPEEVAAIQSVGAAIERVRMLEEVGRLVEARPLAEATVQRAFDLGHRRTEAEALGALAKIEDDEDRDAAAAELLEDAVWRAEAGGADELVADLLARAMGIAVARGRIDEAVALERRVTGALERIGGAWRIEDQFLHARSQLAYERNDLAAAEAYVREGIEARTRDSGARSIAVARHMHTLGVLLTAQGRAAEAEAAHRAALDIRLEWQDASHPDVITVRMGIAVTHDNQGRTAEAQAVLESIVADGERSFTGPSPLLALALTNLAYAYQKSGRIAEAIALVDRSIAIVHGTVGAEDPRLLKPLLLRGILHQAQGRSAEARASYERVIETADLIGSEEAIKVFAWCNLASLELEGRRPERAQQLLTTALDLQQRIHGPEHHRTAQVLHLLAQADLAVGADEAAIAHARLALPILAARGTVEDERWADVQFVLARALMRASPSAAGREAIAAGQAAAERYDHLQDAEAAAEVRAWLANLESK